MTKWVSYHPSTQNLFFFQNCYKTWTLIKNIALYVCVYIYIEDAKHKDACLLVTRCFEEWKRNIVIYNMYIMSAPLIHLPNKTHGWWPTKRGPTSDPAYPLWVPIHYRHKKTVQSGISGRSPDGRRKWRLIKGRMCKHAMLLDFVGPKA